MVGWESRPPGLGSIWERQERAWGLPQKTPRGRVSGSGDGTEVNGVVGLVEGVLGESSALKMWIDHIIEVVLTRC